MERTIIFIITMFGGESMNNLSDFHYALTLAEMLYGIVIREDRGEEILLTGWHLIGNKRMRLYRYTTRVCDGKVELPCQTDQIEAVTTSFEEWNYSTNDTPNGDLHSAFTEAYIEHRKAFRNPLYASGKFIKYERVGDTLYFDRPYGEVNILYRGELLDDDGLPQITDTEARALATYLAYVVKYKEGLMTNNPNIIRLAEDLRLKWLTQADQARNDYYMSQNDYDEILEVKSSWNRKQFGKSLKLYR